MFMFVYVCLYVNKVMLTSIDEQNIFQRYAIYVKTNNIMSI